MHLLNFWAHTGQCNHGLAADPRFPQTAPFDAPDHFWWLVVSRQSGVKRTQEVDLTLSMYVRLASDDTVTAVTSGTLIYVCRRHVNDMAAAPVFSTAKCVVS